MNLPNNKNPNIRRQDSGEIQCERRLLVAALQLTEAGAAAPRDEMRFALLRALLQLALGKSIYEVERGIGVRLPLSESVTMNATESMITPIRRRAQHPERLINELRQRSGPALRSQLIEMLLRGAKS